MADPLDQAEKLRRCGSREERQRILADIFQEHRDRLRNMVVLRLDPRLRSRLDPSDVLQEAFLEVFQRIEEYLRSEPMPLFVWLRRITAQKLAALHRVHLGAKGRDRRREVGPERRREPDATSSVLSERLIAVGATPSETVIQEETRLRVERALDSMEPRDREILALRHFEELSNGEAAQVLGIKENAAATRYFRALGRLKKILADLPGAAGN